MAKAPRPGVGARAEQADAAKSVLVIKFLDRTERLAINNLPLSERLIVRKATGLPYEAFLGEIEEGGADKMGLDSFIVLWWLARRAGGEWQLTFKKVSEEWPDDFDPDDIDVTVETPDDTPDDASEHPEA